MSKSTAPSDDQTTGTDVSDTTVTGPTLTTNVRPAARVGDVTARGDVITTGEPTVLIGGRPATKLGDVTAQRSLIITGSTTLFIGSEATDREPTVQELAAQESAIQDPTVQEARKHIGSEDWAYEADRHPYPPDTDKCNLFVYETLNDSGKLVPMMERSKWGEEGGVIPRPDHPPLAGQWADPSVEILGWEVVDEPTTRRCGSNQTPS